MSESSNADPDPNPDSGLCHTTQHSTLAGTKTLISCDEYTNVSGGQTANDDDDGVDDESENVIVYYASMVVPQEHQEGSHPLPSSHSHSN